MWLSKNHSTKLLNTFARAIFVALILGIFGFVFKLQTAQAADGVNKVITFQGKVVNSTGTNVADGTYDFVIRIYDGAGNSASTLFTESWTAAALHSSTMSSAPTTSDDTLVYSSNTNESTLRVGQILTNTTKSESVTITSVNTTSNTLGISRTRQNWDNSDTITNQIYVKDGVFRVGINSLNADISGVNFNSDSVYMGVEFDSDGEMKPRIQYTAAPYAMNAEKVNGLTVTNTSDDPFSSATTLKIGDGKTVIFSNTLTFSGTDSTVFTLPTTTDTLVGLAESQVLTNKTIGSTGLIFTGATTDITTTSGQDLVINPNGLGRIGLGITAPQAYLDVGSRLGTAPSASFSASTSFASVVLDQTGFGDLFTASKSGSTKFVINNSGNLQLSGGTNYLNTITSAATANRTFTLPDASGTLCLTTTCASDGSSNWDVINGAITPKFSSTLDLLIGGVASTTARFAVRNMIGSETPTASISSGLNGVSGVVLSANGSVQSVNNSSLILGGDTTGNVQLSTSMLHIGQSDGGTPTALTIRGASATGSDVTGADITFDASNGTGSGGSGSFIFRTAAGGGEVVVPPIFDSASESSGGTSTTTQTWAHTVGAGTNRAIFVGVSIRQEGDPDPVVSSVTFNGSENFSLVGRSANDGKTSVELWRLLSPTVTTGNIVVTLDNTAQDLEAGATSWRGVNQTTPTGTFTSNNGNDDTPTITVSSAADEVVIDVAASVGQFTAVGSGQTERWNVDASGNGHGVGSSEPGAVSTTMSWTTNSGQQWTIGAVPLRGVPGGSGVNVLREAFRVDASGNIGIGNTAPVGKLGVMGAVAGKALSIFNETGDQDIFTASKSGVSKFTILNSGQIQLDTANYNNCTILSTTSGLVGCGTGALSNWDVVNGAITPKLSSTLDLLIGGVATGTARFAVTNMIGSETPTASISSGLNGASGIVLSANGSIQSLRNSTLTLGGNTTGNISIMPINGTGRLGLLAAPSMNNLIYSAGTVPDVNNGSGFYVGPSLTSISTNQTGMRVRPILSSASDVAATMIGVEYGVDKTSNVALGSTTIVGMRGANYIAGTGAIGTVTGADVINNFDAAASVTTLTGLQVRNPSNSGGATVTRAYGIYINNQTLGTSRANLYIGSSDLASGLYNIYAETPLNSYFNGNIGIGTTAPVAKLNVSGTTGGNALVMLSETGTRDIFTASASATTRFVIKNDGNVGIGTTAPVNTLDVRGLVGTAAIASVSGTTSYAGLVIDQSGLGDIFTASKSGLTKFAILNSGLVRLDTVNYNNCTGLRTVSGQITCGSDGTSNWTLDTALGIIRPNNGTVDLLIGGSASSSALTKFAGLVGTPNSYNKISGRATGQALLQLNETGNQDVLTASASGVTVFRLTREGGLVLGNTTDGMVFNTTSANTTVYKGAARPTKTVTLVPEYAGGVITAFYGAGTDTNITGSMTSDADTSAANSLRTYYEWSSSQVALHYYSVAVRVKLPKDFAGWATSNAMQVDHVTESTNAANNLLDIRVYLESDITTAVAADTGNVSAVAGTWRTETIDDSVLDDGVSTEWDAADESAVIYLRMGSLSNNYSRIGEIRLNYLAAF